MIAKIDISLFSESDGSLGVVTGELDFPIMPCVGDSIFLFADASSDFASAGSTLIELVVQNRSFLRTGDTFAVMLALSSIESKSIAHTEIIVKHLTSIGLNFDSFK